MSTSINDLPQSGDPANDEDINENMMVNSILKEIENDEDINNENEDSINYVMDSSQVPPKIDNQIPTPDMIRNAAEDIFRNPTIDEQSINEEINIRPINEGIVEPPVEEPKINIKTKDLVNNVDNIMTNLINNVKGPVIVFVLYMVLSLPQLNKLVIKILPKLSTNGSINMLGNLLKAFILSTVYFISSFFI